MKTGVSVFLAAFVAFGLSWLGLVWGPIHQLGGARQTVILLSSDNWPPMRTGDATLGLQVYRSAGCAACHTEQIRQTGAANEIALTSLGNHKPDEFKAFLQSLLFVPELMTASNDIMANLDAWTNQMPFTLYSGDDSTVVGTLAEKLKPVGVKTESRVAVSGADIARGWGPRQSVAVDYLYDTPVQLGSLRAGPDLTTVGVRQPDLNWQLRHLYSPASEVPGSTMPPFRFLFEVRKVVDGKPSPDALALKKEFAPADGLEVVPTAEARELATYLVSLKANAPLYEAPFTAAAAPAK